MPEAAQVPGLSQDGERVDRPDAWDSGEPPAGRILPMPGEDPMFQALDLRALRWRRKFGQLAKVGSTSMKDGLYDWEAEAVHG